MKKIISFCLCCIMLLSALFVPSSAVPEGIPQSKDALLAALYEADIPELRSALDAQMLTSVELTQYYLERIEAYNEHYNCFITICDDALEVAAQRDALRAAGKADGLLFGIPVVIKDNMDLSGYHTTNGFKKKDSQIANQNAAVVDYLLREGAVIIAKANMSTQAQDARRSSSQAVGETKSAYSGNMAAGGSSGGSAVATSLNFAAAALGTDTNSSLRIPAALAGCVSLRPTFGLISLDGIERLNSTRDVPGAITRSVYDQAIMLDVLTQGKQNYTENLNPDRLKGMRIGVLKELSYALQGSADRTEGNIDDEVQIAFEEALAELRSLGAEIIEVSMPNLFKLSNKTFANNDQGPKNALYQAFEELLTQNNVRAVVYPTYLSTPLRALYDEDGTYWDPYAQIYLNNCRTLSPSAGLPEISVPIGLHSWGAGIGMEIASLKNSEQLLLDIAYGYTSRYDHRHLPEGAPNLYKDAYIADLPVVTAGLRISMFVQETAQRLAAGIPENSGAFFVPQTPDYTENTKMLPSYAIIGVGLLAAGAALAVVVSNVQKKKRRKKRRRQPIT